MPGEAAAKAREVTETNAKNYIYRVTPERYHNFIVPDFPLGMYAPYHHRNPLVEATRPNHYFRL